MTTVQDIYQFLDGLATFSTQMSFDNAGFLVGDRNMPVEKALISLDITQQVAEEAVALGCQLIVSHHPVIFHPVKSLTTDDATGRTLRTLVKHDISAICCHTNLDVAPGGVNDLLAQAVGLEGIALLTEEGRYEDGTPYGCCRVGQLPQKIPFAQFLERVNKALTPNGIRYVDVGRPVNRVAVGGGACADYMNEVVSAGCDTFITSDVKYNGFLDAKDLGLNLIDAGHYPTENPVCFALLHWLQEAFPQIDVKLTEKHSEVFHYFKQEF